MVLPARHGIILNTHSAEMLVFEHGIVLDSHVILCVARRQNHGKLDETATACMPRKYLELELLHERVGMAWDGNATQGPDSSLVHTEDLDSICKAEQRSLCTLRCCTPSDALSSPVTMAKKRHQTKTCYRARIFAVGQCHSLPSIVCPGREVPSKSLAVFCDPVCTCQPQYLLRKFEAASRHTGMKTTRQAFQLN